ncbi:MAG: hypothetical protein QME58_04025 [Bacteroidota bacterium]|nr:hypothetical protein [Bacteroidota bacterium]
MRAILFLLFFPLLLMAQTVEMKSINNSMNNLSTFRNTKKIDYSNNLSLSEKFSRSFYQDYTSPFSLNSLSGIRDVGTNLQSSAYWQYSSNILGYLSYLGIKTETRTERSGYYSTEKTEIKVTPLGYALSIGSTVSSLVSIYNTGRAGERLYIIGKNLPSEYGYKLVDAGNNLKSYRTLSYISSGLGLASSILLQSSLNELNNDKDIEDVSGQIYAAGGLALAGLVFKIIAVDNVGEAGVQIESFSNDLHDPRAKNYFSNCGIKLKKFEKRWDAGLIVIGSGLVALMIPNPLAALSGLCLIIVGDIISSWIAPSNMSSAGSALYDFEDR